jgi:hypothetical protein
VSSSSRGSARGYRVPGRHARLEAQVAGPQRDGAHLRAGRRVELGAQADRAQELDAGGGDELAAHLAARKARFLVHHHRVPGARQEQRGGRARRSAALDEDVNLHARRRSA